MKLPRDLSGPDLAKVLRSFGYEVTRQTRCAIWILRQPAPGDRGTELATVLVQDGCQRSLAQLLGRLGLAKRSGPRATFD
jgi:hypothetical protein